MASDTELERLNSATGENFDAVRDWDFHHYDFGTFSDEHCSVATFRRKLESNRTVDDTVIYYVLEAFNRHADKEQFRMWSNKAIGLLQAAIDNI